MLACLQLQRAMEASLQDSYFPHKDHGVSALMQQQQEDMLQLYKTQQVLTQTADTASKSFKPSSGLTCMNHSDRVQQQQPEQHQPESAFASWVKPWRADPTFCDGQSNSHKADPTGDGQTDSSKENSLKLSLDVQGSDQSTSSAELSISPGHKPGQFFRTVCHP